MRLEKESLEEYAERLEIMSDRQLCGELQFYNRMTFPNGKPSLRDVAELTVVQVVFDSFRAGKCQP